MTPLTRSALRSLLCLGALAAVNLAVVTHASAFPGRGGPPKPPAPTCGSTTIYKANGMQPGALPAR